MKKRALLLVFLLVTIAIGITAQQFGRRMLINKGGEVVASYDLPEGTDSITFVLYKICGVTALSSDELRGSVTASSNAVEEGKTVTLTATPNIGYRFINWTVNGEVVSTENPYTATVTENTEYVANFEEGELEYCTISGNSTDSQRYLPSFTLTDGVNDLEVPNIQISTKKAIYHDKTSVIFETEAGATIRFKELPWVGSWMHGYVFIDYTKDGVFNNTLNSNGQTGGELVSYNFYSATDASTGQNSKGETVNNNCGVTTSNMPEWTLPLDLPSGKYRMRFNIAWNTIEPCGYANMVADGGAMVDITIRVVNLPARTISVSVNQEETGTVTINGEAVSSLTAEGRIKLVATPAEGYKFVNWTVNGEVVSTKNPYTVTVTSDIEYVANFEEGELEYCTISGNSTNYERYLPSFTLTDGVNDAVVPNIQTSTGQALYHDKTSVIFETLPGATIRFKELPWVGTWMHGYVFIDYIKDGVFNNTLNSNGQSGGELVSYNFYSATDASTGQNSKGETVNNNCGVTARNMPEWTLPLDLPSGKYRMRFNIAWNSIDPCGYASMGADGGAMVDVTIRVVSKAVAPRTISVLVNDETMGTAYVGEEGITTLDGQTGVVKFYAVANEGYEFVNWTVNGVEVSTNKAIYDITEGDKEYVATFRECKHNGHEYVDLGLPSGLKWATCNVGATTPEGYGDYFAWGETEPKDEYSWSTYKYCNGSSSTMTKYCKSSSYGTVDNKTVLELEDDAAHVNWGGDWRMPTRAEQDELRDTNNCTWEWTTQNGVNGYKVTSVVNGNSIFLPAAGCCKSGGLYNPGSDGDYWSSSLDTTSGSNYAYRMYFNSSYVGWIYYGDGRCIGQSVRAVCE